MNERTHKAESHSSKISTLDLFFSWKGLKREKKKKDGPAEIKYQHHYKITGLCFYSYLEKLGVKGNWKKKIVN